MDRILTLVKKELQKHLLCGICDGLLIDAVALPECHHEFCKSCIVTYCVSPSKGGKGPYLCPNEKCGKEIHKTRPLSMLKNDTAMQTLIYKLFPTVYQEEMASRRAFYAAHPETRAFLTLEDLGTPQNFDWLPREVPAHLTVTLAYAGLLLNDDDRPSEELSRKSQAAQSQPICYHVASDTSIGELKHCLYLKFHLASEYVVVLLLTNVILQDTYSVADIVRYFSTKETKRLHLDFLITDPKSFSEPSVRDAAIERLLRKRPLLVSPTVSKGPSPPDETPPTREPIVAAPVPAVDSTSQNVMDFTQFIRPTDPSPRPRRRRRTKRPLIPVIVGGDQAVVSATETTARDSSPQPVASTSDGRTGMISAVSTDISDGLPLKRKRVRRKKEQIEPTGNPAVRLLLQQKIKRNRRTKHVDPSGSTTLAAEGTISLSLSQPISAEADPKEIMRRCQLINQSFAVGESLLYAQMAQAAKGQNLPTPQTAPTVPRNLFTPNDEFFRLGHSAAVSPINYVRPPPSVMATPPRPAGGFLFGTFPTDSPRPGGYNLITDAAPATVSGSSPGSRYSPTEALPSTETSPAQPVVKRRRRAQKRKVPGDRAKVCEVKFSPNLYEEMGMPDHTYAKDPRLEPIKKPLPRVLPASTALPDCTVTGGAAVGDLQFSHPVSGWNSTGPPCLSAPLGATSSAMPVSSQPRFIQQFMLSQAPMTTVRQTGPSVTYLVGSNGSVDPRPTTSSQPVPSTQTPSDHVTTPRSSTSPKTAKFTSAPVKSGLYPRLAPRPAEDSLPDTVLRLKQYDAQFRPKSPSVPFNGQMPVSEVVRAHMPDDGRAVQLGFPIPGIPV